MNSRTSNTWVHDASLQSLTPSWADIDSPLPQTALKPGQTLHTVNDNNHDNNTNNNNNNNNNKKKKKKKKKKKIKKKQKKMKKGNVFI